MKHAHATLRGIGTVKVFGEIKMEMRKISFYVDVVCSSDVDTDTVKSALEGCLTSNTPGDALCNVSDPVSKILSEQGFKVWRSRVKGVSAKQAGDAANPKSVKAPSLAAPPAEITVE